MSYSQRLTELGLTLPSPPAPVASYAPFIVVDKLVFISGQLPIEDGKVNILGRVGSDVDLPTAQKAAYLCGLNLLAQAAAAAGGKLDGIGRCVKLGGFVASAETFFEQPKVINAASDLMEQVFGAAGKHARFAVGVGALPRNAAVEIDAIFSLK